VRAPLLQKQAPLTEIEAQSLHSHPQRAADQLDCVPGLRRVAKIVRHQLERYDGRGLPDSLRGERIPLGSRILGIAVAFDLLTNCNGERPATWEEALEQLAKERGEVFDPWLVDVFAEEIRKAPPAVDADREVMIVPGGALPWRTATTNAASDDEEDEDDLGGPELEVLLDDTQREEQA
jgi:HD-GYP domain-containing protein (c-di-GMP phosphodiesterase class II)